MSSYDYTSISKISAGNYTAMWESTGFTTIDGMINDIATNQQNSFYDEIIQNYKFMLDFLTYLQMEDKFDSSLQQLLGDIRVSYTVFKQNMEIAAEARSNDEDIPSAAYTTIRINIPYSYESIAFLLDTISADDQDLATMHYIFVRIMDNDFVTADGLLDNDSQLTILTAAKFLRSGKTTMSIITGYKQDPLQRISYRSIIDYNRSIAAMTEMDNVSRSIQSSSL